MIDLFFAAMSGDAFRKQAKDQGVVAQLQQPLKLLKNVNNLNSELSDKFLCRNIKELDLPSLGFLSQQADAGIFEPGLTGTDRMV